MKTKIDKLTIKGINSALSQSVVPDGSCGKLMNMRPKNGTWHAVSDFAQTESFSIPSGVACLYVHPLQHTNVYVARSGQNIFRASFSQGEAIEEELLCIIEPGWSCELYHFGNLLIIVLKKEKEIRNYYFLFREGVYQRIYWDQTPPLEEVAVQFTNEFKTCDLAIVTVEDLNTNKVVKTEVLFHTHCADFNKNDRITGALYLRFAYELYDGSVVKAASILPLSTEGADHLTRESLYRRCDAGQRRYIFSTVLSACQAHLSFSLPQEVLDNPLIKSILVYSTRAIPLYDCDNIWQQFDAASIPCSDGQYKARRNIILSKEAISAIDTPFYRIATIAIDRSKVSYRLTIGYKEFYENIEHKEIYEPNYSIHQTCSSGVFEYNARLHRYGITTHLYHGANPFFVADNFQTNNLSPTDSRLYIRRFLTDYTVSVVVYIKDEMGTKVVRKNGITICHIDSDDQAFINPQRYLLFNNLLSYPDSRAYKMEVYICKENKAILLASYPLKPSYANHCAWYCSTAGYSLNGFSQIALPASFPESRTTVLPSEDRVLVEPNKLIVSQNNNPFCYTPQNTYCVDGGAGTTIHKISCMVDQLSEGSFGNYPLLLFTSAGIYALEQGSYEILYARLHYLMNDLIEANSDVISISGNLFFISSQGVMLLQGRTSQKISQALDEVGVEQSAQFCDYLAESRFCYLAQHNELMLYNALYDYAYIYSLDYKLWYCRTFSGRVININTVHTTNGIYDVSGYQSGALLPPSFLTNALKLSTDQYKRIEALSIDVDCIGCCSDEIELYGSDDLHKWFLIGRSNHRYVRRTRRSYRYFKILYKVRLLTADTPDQDIALVVNSINIESRIRFIRHLRL